MGVRPTTSMKKGWLCRNSYDEKNHEIAPVMIQIQWWSRSNDDAQWWSKSSDDPDPVMMIQQCWSKSSDDPNPVMMPSIDPDWVMIQIQRWRWIEDEDDLKTKKNCRYRCRDAPADTEKKTNIEKLCWKNTFLVKRQCWCICNGMYSSMYLMYFNPMFTPRCIYNVIESCCHAPMLRSGGSIM